MPTAAGREILLPVSDVCCGADFVCDRRALKAERLPWLDCTSLLEAGEENPKKRNIGSYKREMSIFF